MAYIKRLKSDPIFVSNLQDIINALFNGDSPSELLKSTTTKLNMLQFYAGDEYTSFKDFDRSIKSHTKRVVKKEKLTEFLKTHKLETHPHSAYAIFLKENNDKYKKENPDKSHKELRSLMTKVWSEYTDKDKKPYEASYQKQKDAFIERVREIDPDYVVLFDKSQAPKVAPRPYTLFVTEQMKVIRSENPDIMNKSVMKLAGEKWRLLSDDEKKKYYIKCGAEMPTTKKSSKKDTNDESDVKPKKVELKPKTIKSKKVESDSEDEPKPKITKSKKVESDSEDEPKPKITKSKKVESDSEDEPKPKTTKSKKVESDSEEESVPKKKNAPVVKSKGKAALDTVLSNSDQSDSD
jgi:upstream-binding transcription factor